MKTVLLFFIAIVIIGPDFLTSLAFADNDKKQSSLPLSRSNYAASFSPSNLETIINASFGAPEPVTDSPSEKKQHDLTDTSQFVKVTFNEQ